LFYRSRAGTEQGTEMNSIRIGLANQPERELADFFREPNPFSPPNHLQAPPKLASFPPTPPNACKRSPKERRNSQEKRSEAAGLTHLAAEGDALDVDRNDGAAGTTHPRRRPFRRWPARPHLPTNFLRRSLTRFLSLPRRRFINAGARLLSPFGGGGGTAPPIFAPSFLRSPVIANQPSVIID
jgi:hypothetical protein